MSLHQADYYLACIGYAPEAAIPEIPLQAEAVAWRDGYWQRHGLDGAAVLAIAPGSGAREKNWPDIYFRSVADWWRRRTGGFVVVIAGPVEEERGGTTAVSHDAVIARNLTLAQLAALLARSDVYLGNDSGVTHLAAALGVPTVALFGPSDPRLWAPRGGKVTILRLNVECSPCAIALMKSCPHHKCLTALTPDHVIGELGRIADALTLTRGGSGTKVNSQVPPETS
jgi:ADP-heptose:LPS heptosyltransferase